MGESSKEPEDGERNFFTGCSYLLTIHSLAKSLASIRRSQRVDFLTNRLRAGTYIPTYQNLDAGIWNTCKVSGYPRPRDWISSFRCLDSTALMTTVCWSDVGQSMMLLVLLIINYLQSKQRFSRLVHSTTLSPLQQRQNIAIFSEYGR